MKRKPCLTCDLLAWIHACWGTYAIELTTLTVPESFSMLPSMALTSEDLPHPTGPTTAVRLLNGTVRSIWLSVGLVLNPDTDHANIPFSTITAGLSAASGPVGTGSLITFCASTSASFMNLVTRATDTCACTTALISIGSMTSGNRRRLNSESATKAFSGVSALPLVVYVMNVARETKNGAMVQENMERARRIALCFRATSSSSRSSVTLFPKGRSHAYSFRTFMPVRTSFICLIRESFTFICLTAYSFWYLAITVLTGMRRIITASPEGSSVSQIKRGF